MQALGQVEQEGGQALFGAHAAQQQHHAMVAHDLAAHDLVELVLQVGELTRELLQLAIGDHADLRVLECNGVAGVAVCADAIEAQQLACHLKARDLVATVFRRDAGFEKTRAHRVNRFERVARVKEGVSALDGLARGH